MCCVRLLALSCITSAEREYYGLESDIIYICERRGITLKQQRFAGSCAHKSISSMSNNESGIRRPLARDREH